MKKIIAISLVTLAAACGDADYEKAQQDVADSTAELNGVVAETDALVAPATPIVQPEPIELSDDDKGRVCRAAIASLNGRDPAVINVISYQGGIHRVRYTRDDGTVWTNECRVGDGTAESRIVENGQPGRWRTEETISFTVDGDTIGINTFMGGEPWSSDRYIVQ